MAVYVKGFNAVCRKCGADLSDPTGRSMCAEVSYDSSTPDGFDDLMETEGWLRSAKVKRACCIHCGADLTNSLKVVGCEPRVRYGVAYPMFAIEAFDSDKIDTWWDGEREEEGAGL